MKATEDKKFNVWKKRFDKFLKEMLDELQDSYLNELGLTVHINEDYEFTGRAARWLAVYEYSSRLIKQNIISIGINYPLLYDCMVERKISTNMFNIEAQARITIGHEIGHGIVDYIKTCVDVSKCEPTQIATVLNIKKLTSRKEERLVEEFGESLFPEATGTWSCTMESALDELISIK